MFSLVLLLCCAGALVSSAPQKTFYNVEDAHSHFEDFVQTYNKEYTNEAEKQARFEIFKNNLENINMKNKMSQSAVFGKIIKVISFLCISFVQQALDILACAWNN